MSCDGQPLTTWTPSDESKGLVRCSVPANTPFCVGCVATPYIASHQQADSTVAEQAACRLKIWCKSRHFLLCGLVLLALVLAVSLTRRVLCVHGWSSGELLSAKTEDGRLFSNIASLTDDEVVAAGTPQRRNTPGRRDRFDEIAEQAEGKPRPGPGLTGSAIRLRDEVALQPTEQGQHRGICCSEL